MHYYFTALVDWNLRAQEAVWKSRWTSWAPVPNKPTVPVDVKQQLNQRLELKWLMIPNIFQQKCKRLTIVLASKDVYSSSKVKQLFTRSCSNFSKLLPQNLHRGKAYPLVYLQSACSQFHMHFTPVLPVLLRSTVLKLIPPDGKILTSLV